LPRFQLLQAGAQPAGLLRRLDQLERGRSRIAYVIGGLDRVHAAAQRARPQPVDGPIARDRHQPGDWAGPARVEAPGLAPDRHVDLLQHVLGLASVVQDTQADAEKLRRGVLIDDAERGAVAGGDAGYRRGKLAAIDVAVHPHRSRRAAAWAPPSIYHRGG